MKTINVTFTKQEHQRLSNIKLEKSWHDFILDLALAHSSNYKEVEKYEQDRRDNS